MFSRRTLLTLIGLAPFAGKAVAEVGPRLPAPELPVKFIEEDGYYLFSIADETTYDYGCRMWIDWARNAAPICSFRGVPIREVEILSTRGSCAGGLAVKK